MGVRKRRKGCIATSLVKTSNERNLYDLVESLEGGECGVPFSIM